MTVINDYLAARLSRFLKGVQELSEKERLELAPGTVLCSLATEGEIPLPLGTLRHEGEGYRRGLVLDTNGEQDQG